MMIHQYLDKYLSSTTKEIELSLFNKVSKIVIRLMLSFLLAVPLIIMLLFLSIGLSMYLNEILATSFLGYLIVAGIYCIGVLTLLLVKDKIKGMILEVLSKDLLIDKSKKYLSFKDLELEIELSKLEKQLVLEELKSDLSFVKTIFS